MKNYKDECHYDDCDTKFIGADRDDYVKHIRQEHGDTDAEIYDKLIVSQCSQCGTLHQDEYGICPECGGDSHTPERY